MPQSRLFVQERLASASEVALGREQSHYLGRVLRMRVGDALVVFDGSGREFPATIAEIGKDQAVLKVGQGVDRDSESPLQVRLLQCVCKGERMDFVLQKVTELGVTEVLPVVSERTIVRLGGKRAQRRTEHWQRIAVSACEQSGRNRVPRVHDVLELAEALEQPSAADLQLVLAPGASAGIGEQVAPANNQVDLLIGPEGGLSETESAAAVRAGFVACHIGPRILRTETAGVAALAALQSAWGDL